MSSVSTMGSTELIEPIVDMRLVHGKKVPTYNHGNPKWTLTSDKKNYEIIEFVMWLGV